MKKIKNVGKSDKRINPREVAKACEAEPLFAEFLDALVIDAIKHLERLKTAEEIWGKEWADLLRGVWVDALIGAVKAEEE